METMKAEPDSDRETSPSQKKAVIANKQGEFMQPFTFVRVDDSDVKVSLM
jgi:hypothetical protein